MTTRIEETIDIAVPLHKAYSQWTDFEQFPRYMEGIKEVRKVDDTHLHWVGEFEGETVEWDSELVQEVPDELIAWHNTGGGFASGVVRFVPLDEQHTRISLEMQSDGADASGACQTDPQQASQSAKHCLQRFKESIESQCDEQAGAATRAGSGDTGPGRAQSSRTEPSTLPFSSATASSTWLPQMLSMWEEPFTVMRRMSEELDRMVERFVGRRSGYVPAGARSHWMSNVEVRQVGDTLQVTADLPGLCKEDVTIEIRDDKLFIEGQRVDRDEGSEQASLRSARPFGHFYRMIALPQGVDPERAQARMEDGVLQVTLPIPSTQQRGRRIEVQQGRPALQAAEPQTLEPVQTAHEAEAQEPIQSQAPGPQPAQVPPQQSLH